MALSRVYNGALSDKGLLASGVLFIIIACFAVVIDKAWIGALIPLFLIGIYLVCFKLLWLYRFLFFIIPLSIEIELPGGLGTDLPGEPILWLLAVLTGILFLYKGLPKRAINKVSLLLLIHLGWIACASIFALDPVISIKYLLAKTWYILPFYFLPFYLIPDIHEVRFLFKCFLAGTFFGACYFFSQHWQVDLSYLSRTNIGLPIWRNHVNYACTLVLNLPILWYLHRTSKHPDKWIYSLVFGLFLVFIYFSYTRIAYIAMIGALCYYLILSFGWTKWAILISLLSIVLVVLLLSRDKRFVALAPQYDQTIMQSNFEGKLAATTQGQDISTMERIHRWVAGTRMVQERPWTGFGPGNFYAAYKPYTIFSFETYVSDNPERSGIHNYYLMVLVEQGIIGCFIFILLIVIALLRTESLVHQTTSLELKRLFILLGIMLVMMLFINSVNDMIETIKLGSLFFLVLSLFYHFDPKLERRSSESAG